MISRASKNMLRSFLTGLAVVVPIVVTVSVVYWIASVLEAVLGGWIRFFMPELVYSRGVGVVIGLVLVTLLGFLLQHEPLHRLLLICEQGIERVPLIRVLYGAARDLMVYVTNTGGQRTRMFNKVVMVKVGGTQVKLIGLVTRDDLTQLPRGIALEDSIMVYLPMSYQLGGYTAVVPRSAIEPIEMSVEEAMRFTMTAGVSKDPTNHQGNGAAPRPSKRVRHAPQRRS